jgi:hypothetical protein
MFALMMMNTIPAAIYMRYDNKEPIEKRPLEIMIAQILIRLDFRLLLHPRRARHSSCPSQVCVCTSFLALVLVSSPHPVRPIILCRCLFVEY